MRRHVQAVKPTKGAKKRPTSELKAGASWCPGQAQVFEEALERKESAVLQQASGFNGREVIITSSWGIPSWEAGKPPYAIRAFCLAGCASCV
jgi:hypothetical protein